MANTLNVVLGSNLISALDGSDALTLRLFPQGSPDVRTVHRRMAINTVLTSPHGHAAVGVAANIGRPCVECRLPVTAKTGDTLTRHE